MRGLLAHTVYRSIYHFIAPIINQVDGLYWASDNTSPVDMHWLMSDDNEELYFNYRIKFGETIRDYDELPDEYSIIKKEDYAIYRPHMLTAFGSQLVHSEGDTDIFFGIMANSTFEACDILSQILVETDHSRLNALNTAAIIDTGTIFISSMSNMWWRIYADEAVLESLKAKARFQCREIDSDSSDEELVTRNAFTLS